jgi:glycosyltransferase involved in cell wall biosynthesis
MLHNRYKNKGGEDQSYEAEAQVMLSKGHEVETLEVSNEELQTSNLETALRGVWNPSSYDSVADLIDSFQPDILRCFNLFPQLSPSVYYAAKRRRIPIVQSLHNYRLFCVNGLFLRDGRICELCLGRNFAWPGVKYSCYRDSRPGSLAVASIHGVHRFAKTWNKIDAYIALTDFMKEKFIQGGLPSEKIHTRSNFIHPNPVQGSGDGRFALFAGRISPEKGLETILQAWESKSMSVPLKIVGTGPEQERLRNEFAPSDKVQWLGQLSHTETLELMGQSTFTIAPSTWYEPFGRVIIESFAKGTPVVAANLGAIPEAIDPGVDGYLFPPGDASELIRSVQQILSNEAHRQEMRTNARAKFATRYSSDVIYENSMEIFRKAIEIKRGKKGVAEAS